MSRLPIVATLALALAGCSAANESRLEDAAILEAAAATASEAANRVAATSAGRATGSAPQKPARFEPPFPHRTSLFEPPRGGQSSGRRDEEHGNTIELKGFVDVNGPRAVLSIDGVLSPIPEGGEKYGVQVISIKPPQVVLQRGRSRWTASLE